MSTKHFIVTDTADYSILGQVRVYSSLFYSNDDHYSILPPPYLRVLRSLLVCWSPKFRMAQYMEEAYCVCLRYYWQKAWKMWWLFVRAVDSSSPENPCCL